jgi:hypothetical protein
MPYAVPLLEPDVLPTTTLKPVDAKFRWERKWPERPEEGGGQPLADPLPLAEA